LTFSNLQPTLLLLINYWFVNFRQHPKRCCFY